ncbi:hypothetical protein MKW92_051981 [Papaver armeniacum]|nr:hypothetical protein MKW92_051981 [Papaver armeniacum]
MKEKYDGLRQVMKEVQENGVEKAVVSELVVESSLSVRDSSLVGNMSNEKTMEINSSKLVSESVVESSCVLRDSSMGGHMSSKKIMEINPENAIMEELRKRSDADMNDKFVRDLSLLLFEIASLTSGCGPTKRKSLAVSQGYTSSQGEPEEEMDARKQICTNDNKKFYLVGVATVVDSPYAGPNFFEQLPADIRDLLQKFPECQTIEDLEIALSKRRNGITEPECLLMDLENDLKALKELSSALYCKYARCLNNIQELGLSTAVVYRELVEQVCLYILHFFIWVFKEYETLFTGGQRFSIEKALEAKLRKDILTSVNPQGAPEIRLMFQKKLVANENKSVEESNRRKILVRLCSTVKYSANTLESRLHLVDDEQIRKREGWEDYSGKDYKRNRLVWPTREVRKLEESEDGKKKKVETSIKEKFEGLCKVIKEILGDRVEKVVVSECVS